MVTGLPVRSACLASKKDIARGFGKARATYEGASRLQRLMGNTMLEVLQSQVDLNRVPIRALDLGCGTGWFTRRLAGLGGVGSVMGMDLSPGMVEQAGASEFPDVAWVVADAEAIPLPNESCDLIFSNLMIQWCADPSLVLRECRRVLRPGGRLMVSTLLDGTLKELDHAWQLADPGQSHINRFEQETAFREAVSRELPGADIVAKNLRLPCESPLALAAELKQLGAGYKGAGRRLTVTAPNRLRAMCRHYPTEPEGGVVASYEAAWVYWTCREVGGNTNTSKSAGHSY
ncbi:MAG: malonyl-ACP O-methyltransferase BioC [Marinobacter sp.]|nr:malonyl-ACP O-methyltransferase BioC [Marinobacter sp.]